MFVYDCVCVFDRVRFLCIALCIATEDQTSASDDDQSESKPPPKKKSRSNKTKADLEIENEQLRRDLAMQTQKSSAATNVGGGALPSAVVAAFQPPPVPIPTSSPFVVATGASGAYPPYAYHPYYGGYPSPAAGPATPSPQPHTFSNIHPYQLQFPTTPIFLPPPPSVHLPGHSHLHEHPYEAHHVHAHSESSQCASAIAYHPTHSQPPHHCGRCCNVQCSCLR